ncbi:bifunctional precorrin-2 dehydrogenase/sirohydrochlorin ferrochelatase [Thalassorhabdus alkalitolerans]|uniref:precorrin-2 dehydrogenase n=1 Tax=Thalassorhabdus alkalitolerans TaxID=2282697 RepID=A0ABW0YQ05_9BACI
MRLLPLSLDISQKTVVVVGGGPIAARKTEKVLSAGGIVTVVAPQITEKLEHLSNEGKIKWVKDVCRPAYLVHAFMIISASGSKEAQSIIQRSAQPGQLINGADNPAIGNVAFTATIEHEDCMISISTLGKDPSLAKRMKHKLQKMLNKEEK